MDTAMAAAEAIMHQPRARRRALKMLRWVEIAAWSVGVLLLVLYAATRWWYAQARDEGVAAFAAKHAAAQAAPSQPAATPLRVDSAVDMSTWSRERIERYRDSLRAAHVPQAVLRIPSVKLVVPVYDGTSDHNLNRGAGRIEGTAHIGEPGNVGIAAHRDGFFRALKDVRVGDILVLEHAAATDAYRIVTTSIVDPTDVSVLDPTDARTVTLVTCYPFYYVGSAPRRFIVHAQRLAPAEKAPAGESPAGAESRVASGGGDS
jgi:sortase A